MGLCFSTFIQFIGQKGLNKEISFYFRSNSYLLQEGVVFLIVTDGHCPRLVAFATLLELSKEFFESHSNGAIQAVLRPYALMSFETNIQKIRKECANPNYIRNHFAKLSDQLQTIPTGDWNDYTDTGLPFSQSDVFSENPPEVLTESNTLHSKYK
jgi:hypothetical protein